MAREFFHCYNSYLQATKRLSDEELGRLFRALMQYSSGEEVSEMTGREEVLFDILAQNIDRDIEKYDEKCRKNAENGSRGGRPKANGLNENRTVIEKSERFAEKANGFSENRTVISETQKSQEKEKEEEKEEYSECDNKSNKISRTHAQDQHPILDQVKAYALEANLNHTNPSAFFNYYVSNGWMAGSVPITDWKAKLREWDVRDKDKGARGKPMKLDYDFDDLEKKLQAN